VSQVLSLDPDWSADGLAAVKIMVQDIMIEGGMAGVWVCR